jgi:hypothetical protein
MTDSDLVAYARDLLADVLAAAEAESLSAPEAFTRRVLEDLEQAGEVENTFAAYYAAHGVEASGYGSNESLGSLDIFVTHFRQVPERLNRAGVEALLRRASNFVRRCQAGLAGQLDEASDVHDMCDAVQKALADVPRLRLFLLTNAVCPNATFADSDDNGLTVSHHVWDLARLERLSSSGTLSEPIVVEFNPPLPCLTTPDTDRDYSVLLSILPGDVLADLYGQYGTRLLELNVRSFLQARGLVNKGIRQTLLNEPERFLAYNNGITATASRVDFVDPPGPADAPLSATGSRPAISRIHDLQIVNGGQTTASIHHAHARDRAEVDRVFVQMKLTVVSPDRLQEIVPEISKYSNTQNKVTVVDFSSNHPFHVGLEQMTRSLWAPAADGSGQETRWFYERARGQYADALARERTPANQRKFRALHPVSQKFSKSDAAKYLQSWRQLPHIVSRGAEKNFHAFMTMMGDAVPTTNAVFSQRLIAMAILFKTTDRIVAAQRFGGYKINITAYTVSKLSQATGRKVDLDRVWREQRLTDDLEDALREISILVQRVITSPERGTNIGEWAKKPECWEAVSEIPWSPSENLVAELVDAPLDDQEAQDTELSATVSAVHTIAAAEWSAVAAWARETQNLQPWERQLASTVARYINNGWTLTERQATQANRVLAAAQTLGFRTAQNR